MPPSVVLVTGASRYLGAHVAARLATDAHTELILAVDTTPPRGDLSTLLEAADGKVKYVRADIRGPGIAKIINDHRVDTVAHMAVAASPARAGGRAAMKELNVIGTMQLLAACQRSDRVSRLVVRSSTAAYGASARDPAIFTEDTEPRAVPRGGYAKDIVEIEGYVRGFRRRRPDVAVTGLRFAPLVGARAETALTRYFSLPVVPTVFGRDPRIQFIHVEDALEVLYRSITGGHDGVYNVAGPGVLQLSQAIRRAGRLPLAVPEVAMSGLAAAFRRGGIVDFSLDQLDFLVHGRVVDISRLRADYGFTPRSTMDAFDDFVRGHDLASVISPDNLVAAEQAILRRLGRGAG